MTMTQEHSLVGLVVDASGAFCFWVFLLSPVVFALAATVPIADLRTMSVSSPVQ
jgi:hypothetical protein